jgi:hypothetical protein
MPPDTQVNIGLQINKIIIKKVFNFNNFKLSILYSHYFLLILKARIGYLILSTLFALFPNFHKIQLL